MVVLKPFVDEHQQIGVRNAPLHVCEAAAILLTGGELELLGTDYFAALGAGVTISSLKGFGAAVTVTATLALTPSAVAVMVAVPALAVVKTPVPITLTTEELDDVQDTVLLVAFSGSTVAFNWIFSLLRC